jgi:hypothetical protein
MLDVFTVTPIDHDKLPANASVYLRANYPTHRCCKEKMASLFGIEPRIEYTLRRGAESVGHTNIFCIHHERLL